jgi:hypothetical protein
MSSVGSLRRGRLPFRTRLSRGRWLLAALIACAVVITGCQAAGTGPSTISPINGANSPTPIDGYTNGYLPASQLYTYSSTCQLYRPAVGSFAAMIAAAKADGVDLTPVQCYRDYANQIYWRNYWCGVGICANAAVPGTSNHGWGKAADFADQNGSLTWNSIGYQWLVANAGAWGWNHPSGVDEAWHWEWVGDGGTMHGYPIRPDLMSWNPVVSPQPAPQTADRGGAVPSGI